VLAVFPGAAVTTIEEGWEDGWRRFHHGVEIGPLWVGPPWETAPSGAVRVVIDPGRAFGTGAHATTRLCLELLVEERRGGLLDVGCGSGVIAIAAAKLGYDPVSAVDVDDVAVEAAHENARRNGVEIDAYALDVRRDELPAAGLAVANISLGLVEAAGGRLESGRAITSGYLASDLPTIGGYRRIERRERDGWAADVFERL
jgi:ribosomal protein L11 methyltransferase